MAWLIFALVIAGLFVSDLWTKTPTLRGSIVRTAICALLAAAFGAFLLATHGADSAVKFATGYVLETSLSLDNVFVISLIFGALSIPQAMRHRVLLIGILTALVLRGIFIGAGSFLAGRFDWLLIGCGAFLVWTGGKLLLTNDGPEIDLERNRALKILRRFVPITHELCGQRFFIRGAVTPLLVALVLVEIADVVFAADSVPATLAVTTDPLLVYTSNIFAIVGLRSLYGVLEALVNAFEYVGKAVAVVLLFVGLKVIGERLGLIHIPNVLSLAVVVSLLGAGVGLSLVKSARHAAA